MEENGRVRSCGRRLVLAALQDGGDRLVGARVEQERTCAGGIETLCAVALDEPENPDGGAEALLGMRTRAQDDVDQSVGVGADLGGGAANALMGPVAVAAMLTRHVLGDRRWPMRQSAAQVRGDALAAQENLDGPCGDSRLDLLVYETVRNAVVVLGDLDMIVEIDAAALPLRILVGLVREGQQCRAIEFVEELVPAASPAGRRALGEIDQKAADRLVESCKREEAAVPQPRQNPAADDLPPHLNFGFVLWMMWACRRYGGAVMAGEGRLGGGCQRFWGSSPRDTRLEIVADRLPRRSTEIREGANVRSDPVR